MLMNGERVGRRSTVSEIASGNIPKPNGKLFLSIWILEQRHG